jgi:hypothetical protein
MVNMHGAREYRVLVEFAEVPVRALLVGAYTARSEFVKIPFSNKLFHENLWYTSPARRSNHAPAEKKHRDQV